MAAWRCVYGGGSWGRSQAIINHVLDNWPDFDAWCCVRGVDPIELNTLRFFNLALYFIKEGRDEEGLKELEQELRQCDSFKHPLHMIYYGYSTKSSKKKKPTTPQTVSSNTPTQGYVPSWWRGDSANAKIAMNMMKQLPK